MKKAYLNELQSQLTGHVTESKEARDYFSTDGSIFTMEPEAIVYPKNTADVRKTVAFLAERAASGKKIGLIGRGRGTDQGGGAVGHGIQMVFPAHMDKLLRLDKDTVTVQPGILYKTLQQTLHTHGRFLPPYPSSINFSTLGGAVANNACGEKTFKYGATRDYVKSLKVVLSDGSLIETHRISARELNRKKGQSDLEGQIYRQVDSLILDHEDLIAKHQPHTSKNAAGYALGRVRGKDGSFDLGQVIVGSQGTLGLVTEITFKTMAWNPRTTLLVGFFDDLKKAGLAITKLAPLGPSAMELADYHLLDFLRKHRPQDIEGLVPETLPKIIVLVEFDETSQLSQTIHSKRAGRLLAKYAASYRVSTDPVEQEALWKIRRSAAAVIWMNDGPKKALPFIEDGVVPAAKLPEFLEKTYKLLNKYELEIAVWGHAGDANLHMQPFLDLSKKKDVDKLFDLSREFFDMVIAMGGSTCAEHNDGLMRAPYLQKLYGPEMYDLFLATKRIFDPLDFLNPNKKVNVTEEYARQFVRSEYSMKHLYDHLTYN